MSGIFGLSFHKIYDEYRDKTDWTRAAANGVYAKEK